MKGSPQPELENLRNLMLEHQALFAVMDCKFRALSNLVIYCVQELNMSEIQGRPLLDILNELTNLEIERKLATISDDDPNHAAQLKAWLEAAKR